LDLVAVAIEFAAVLVQVAIFATKLATLMVGSAVVTVAQVAAQFVPIVRNPGLIVTDVAMQAAIRGERGCYSHACQQQNPSYRAFHVLLAPSQAVDVNTRGNGKLQQV
jgi:hypothetical protein